MFLCVLCGKRFLLVAPPRLRKSEDASVRMHHEAAELIGWNAAGLYVLADEFDDVIHWCAGIEDSSDSGLLEEFEILFRDNAAYQQENIFHFILPEQLCNPGHNRVVSAG